MDTAATQLDSSLQYKILKVSTKFKTELHDNSEVLKHIS